MGVVVHIVVLIVVLTATAHCSGIEEFMTEWNEGMDRIGMSRDELVAQAVYDNKTGNYEDMLKHIMLVAAMWDPLNYTERCLLFTALNKVMLPRIKILDKRRYICYIIFRFIHCYSSSSNRSVSSS